MGLNLLKALPSFNAATETLGKNMKLMTAQEFYIIENSYMLIG
jgi:hypothetical protein